MSEENGRNFESTPPEAAENIQVETQDSEIQQEPAAEMEIPEQEEVKQEKSKKKSSAVLPLVIVLMALLLVLGVLVAYSLGHAHGARQQEQIQEEVTEEAEVAEDIPAYDAFNEELTLENQAALNALSGVEVALGGDNSALLGEDAPFAGDDSEEDAIPAEPVVVAEYGDGQTLMSDEVLAEYSEQLAMYILSGYSEEEVSVTLLDEVLEEMVARRVMAEHAQEMGLYELTDEDRAEIEAQAAELYDAYVNYYREYMVNTDGMTDEEADGAAKAYLYDMEGVNYEYLVGQLEQNWWEQKLFNMLTESVTIDDAAVQAAYEARIAEQKENFTEYPEDFEFARMNGETIVYNLPGYRAVKMLLLGFDDEESLLAMYALREQLASEDLDDDHLAERMAELEAYYTSLEARAREALEQLRAGADMDEMIESIGVDLGMSDERLRAEGYYVAEGSTFWPEDFIRAAMALESVGDYSEPVHMGEGVCILQYLGDVPEGEVPLADVVDVLTEEVLDTARHDVYEAQLQAWLDEVNPSYYPERMQ